MADGRPTAAAIAEVRSDPGFPILPPPALFDHWERQGVLMLNASLTCRLNAPGSHREVWLPFTTVAGMW